MHISDKENAMRDSSVAKASAQDTVRRLFGAVNQQANLPAPLQMPVADARKGGKKSVTFCLMEVDKIQETSDSDDMDDDTNTKRTLSSPIRDTPTTNFANEWPPSANMASALRGQPSIKNFFSKVKTSR